MKKNKKLELKKETITILDKMQAGNVVGGYDNSRCGSCAANSCAGNGGECTSNYTCPDSPCAPSSTLPAVC